MATALPTHIRMDDEERGGHDTEPLLGDPGDVSVKQPESKPIAYNLITGTALLGQAGVLILVATVWAAILMNKVMLFSFHPLANSGALLFGVEAILFLQPTHTPQQKRIGALVHGSFNLIAFLGFAAGLIIIEYNKGRNPPHPRFSSAHGILGLVTYIVLLIQTAIGFTMYFVPSLYGSVDKAKSIWKYHRMSGYLVLTLALATICAATYTDFNVNVLDMKLWVTIVSSVLILMGLVPRIRLAKLGYGKH